MIELKKDFSKAKASLLIKTKKNLFLNTSGEHVSALKGNGLDFKEIREYSSGDDVRHINWKVTARNMQPFINVFNEDKQLNIVLVYLNSGSTFFGTHKSKQDTMAEVMTALGISATKSNDLITSVFFSTNEDKYYRASKDVKMVDININTIYDLSNLGNEINYKNLTTYLLSKIKNKSLIFLIGDFLDDVDFHLLSKKHEVYCAIVRDRFEENLSLHGEFNLMDTNSFDSEDIYLDDTSIKNYNNLMKQHDTKLFKSLKKSHIKYAKIYTNDKVVPSLQKLLKA